MKTVKLKVAVMVATIVLMLSPSIVHGQPITEDTLMSTTDTSVIQQRIVAMPSQKSGTASWALSFFVFPGAGQIYNGEHAKGLIMGGVFIGGMAAFLSSDDLSTGEDEFIWFGVMMASWFTSWIDAPARSREINKQNGYADHRCAPVPEAPRSTPSLALTVLRFDL